MAAFNYMLVVLLGVSLVPPAMLLLYYAFSSFKIKLVLMSPCALAFLVTLAIELLIILEPLGYGLSPARNTSKLTSQVLFRRSNHCFIILYCYHGPPTRFVFSKSFTYIQ